MSDAISWNLQMNLVPAKLEEFRALMNEMVESTLKEEGALTYEWFVSDDGSVCHINERYADSSATMVHLGSFGENYAERFMQLVEPTSFSVYGPASDDVREALAGFQPAHLGLFGGFRR
jgi:quinol monooxygenase YgiN